MIYVLFTKCEVKITSWWLISFFTGSLNNANNPARVLANKNFFTCTTNSGNPKRVRKAHLAHLGSK